MEFIKRTQPVISRHRFSLILVVLLVFLGAGVAALLPWPMKLVVDNVLYDKPLPESLNWLLTTFTDDTTFWLLVIFALTSVALHALQRGFQLVQGWIETGVGERITYDIGEQLLSHLQKMSLLYHSTHSSGDLIRRITTDSRYLQETILGVLIPVLTSSVTLILMFAIMLNLHVGLTLVALAAAVPIPFLIRALSPKMTEYTYQHQQSEGRVMSIAEQTLTGLPVVQAFSQEDRHQNEFQRLSERSMRDYLKSIKAQLVFSVGVSSSTAAGTAIMLLVGGFAALKQSITLGELLVFLSYVASLYGPIETLAYISSTYASAKARAIRVFEVLDEPTAVVDSGSEKLSMDNGAEVSVENVSFSYKPEEPVLKNTSIKVAAGETIALVGSTGSGKSTLVSLIPRFNDPSHGTIKINGTDIKTINLSDLRENISIVLQDPYLLPVSIADNISYGKPGATRSDIIKAAKTSNADEFIQKLPMGYDTVLSEQGSDLSGGQKQRLAIARALLKDAPILILDEPTSALDVRTEALFFEALNNLMQGRTSFIIAHRLSTIRNADRIIVLDSGQVIESGTHQQLMKMRGAYHALHEVKIVHDQKAA